MQGLTKRQQQIVEFIEHYISEKKHSPSYREIQKFFGFSSLGSVYNHIQVLKRKEVLSKEKGIRTLTLNTKKNASFVEIPLIGKLKGGMPIETFSQISTLFFPTHMLPQEDKHYYFLQIEGNGLAEEMILDKDLLLIEPKRQFEEGETVIAIVDHLTTFVKKAFYERPYIRLESANTEVSPLFLREDDVEIQGVVVSLFRNY